MAGRALHCWGVVVEAQRRLNQAQDFYSISMNFPGEPVAQSRGNFPWRRPERALNQETGSMRHWKRNTTDQRLSDALHIYLYLIFCCRRPTNGEVQELCAVCSLFAGPRHSRLLLAGDTLK